MRVLPFALVFLFIFGQACNPFGDCGGKVDPYFDVKGLVSFIYTKGQFPVPEGDTVPFLEFEIELSTDVRFYTAWRADFGGTLIACSPNEPGYMGSQEVIDSLVITSAFDFDANHPAGAPLNEIFYVDDRFPSLSTDGGGNQTAFMELDLKLKQAPTQQKHRFFVDLYLAGGEHYRDSTQQVIIAN